MEFIIKRFLTIGILSVAFIPLITSNLTYFPLATGKNFIFRILVEILFVGWLLLVYWDKKYLPKFSWVLGSLISFVAIIFIADLNGVNFYHSFWGDYQRMEGLITFLHLLAYFIVTISVLTSQYWKKLFSFHVLTGFLLCLVGIFQFFGFATIQTGDKRIDASFGNAGWFASYLLLVFFLTLFLLIQNKEKRRKTLYSLIMILEIFVLYLTATRSAFIGLIGGFFIFTVIFILKNTKLSWLKKIITIILITGTLATGFVLIRDSFLARENKILGRLTSINLESIKTEPRLYIWLTAIEGFKERPILGWGQENFNVVYYKYYHPLLFGTESRSDRTHNIILEWLLAGGLLGLLAYLSIFVVSLYYLWWSEKSVFKLQEKNIWTAFLFAYFLNNLFLFDNIATYIIFVSFLAYLHRASIDSSIYSDEKENNLIQEKEKKEVKKPMMISFGLVIIFGGCLIYFVNSQAIISAYELKKGVESFSENPEKSLTIFKRSLAREAFGNYHINRELSAIVLLPEFKKLSFDLQKDFSDLTIEDQEKKLKLYNYDPHLFYAVGVFHYYNGNFDQALVLLKQSHDMAPTNQNILLAMRDVYIKQNKPQEAYLVAKEAWKLNPDVFLPHFKYAISTIYAINDVSDPEFIDAVNFLETQNRIGKNNPEPHLALATAYKKQGLIEKSINMVKKAVSIDPTLEDTAKQWVDDLIYYQ